MEVEVKGVDEQGRHHSTQNLAGKVLKNKKAIVSAKGDTIELNR